MRKINNVNKSAPFPDFKHFLIKILPFLPLNTGALSFEQEIILKNYNVFICNKQIHVRVFRYSLESKLFEPLPARTIVGLRMWYKFNMYMIREYMSKNYTFTTYYAAV